MIFLMLQYDMFWSYISCQLADTIYYSATSFSFSVSTFLASFGVPPKLKLKRKMSTKPWCPLKVCKRAGMRKSFRIETPRHLPVSRTSSTKLSRILQQTLQIIGRCTKRIKNTLQKCDHSNDDNFSFSPDI